MSDYALQVVRELYGIGQVQFMREWYDRMPDISSMWFVEFWLEKIKEDVSTQTLSDEDN